MTVLFIDPEHPGVLVDPVRSRAHRDRLSLALGALASASDFSVESRHFLDATPENVSDVAPSAIVIGGCMTDWSEYDFDTFAGLFAIIRRAEVPLLGICAGHQLIGYANGASWGALDPLQPGETDVDPSFVPGQRKQRGFSTVTVDPRCPLFAGFSDRAEIFQSHYWQLCEVPTGFTLRASSGAAPIQAIERDDRPVFGVQFHPERFDASHPDGMTVLSNFLSLASHGVPR